MTTTSPRKAWFRSYEIDPTPAAMPSDVPSLVRLLRHPSPATRIEAIQALGQVGPEMVEPLCEMRRLPA